MFGRHSLLIAWWRLDRFLSREMDAKPSGAARAARASPDPSKRPRPGLAVATMSALYVTFAAWMFVAWYRAHKPLSQYRWGGDGWMGSLTYAGGADKCGHAWATMALARLGTDVMTAVGGFNRLKSSIVSALMSESGFHRRRGARRLLLRFCVLRSHRRFGRHGARPVVRQLPRLRELCAYRVEYFPSRSYARKISGRSPCPGGSCSRWNIAEDYWRRCICRAAPRRHQGDPQQARQRVTLRRRRARVRQPQLSADARPRHRKANPAEPVPRAVDQRAGHLRHDLREPPSKAAQRAKTITHGLFEVFRLPLDSVRMVGTSREGPVRPLRPGKAPTSQMLPEGSNP